MTVQLPQILIRNSFNILGLSSSSALKEIRKRSQQLLQFAKIEEVQEFEIDIGHVKEFRNEGEIRLALERVSGIQDRLKEIFFWFEDHQTESLKALEFISKGSYQKAFSIFEASGSDWLDKKNLALALMFHAFASSSMDSFCRSLDVWKLIVQSDDFWKFYEKHYLLHDELGTSPSLFEEFRSSLFETLSMKTVSFYHQIKNPKVIGIFYSAFGRIGKAFDSEILHPVILKIKREIYELGIIANTSPLEVVACLTILHGFDSSHNPENEEIDLMKLNNIKSSNKSDSYITVVTRICSNVNNLFDSLNEFKLLEYSPLIVLRNDVAEKLRSIAVDIYNQNSTTEPTTTLLDISSQIAVSESLIDKIESDKKQLSKNTAWGLLSSEFAKIESEIANQNFQEAMNVYLSLDKMLAEQATESNVEIRQQFLINYCALIIQKGHELFEHKRFGIKVLALQPLLNRKNQKNSIKLFDQAKDLLKTNIHTINFDNPTHDVDEALKLIKELSHSLLICERANLIDHYEYCLSKFTELSETQTDSQTRELISLMGIASCFSSLYYRVRGITQGKMWKWIGYSAAILFYIFVVMNKDNSTSNKSYKSSGYQKKSAYESPSYHLTSQEQEAIDWFDILYEDSLKSLRDKGHSDQKIARVILKKMKENGYSDVVEYLKDLETKAQ